MLKLTAGQAANLSSSELAAYVTGDARGIAVYDRPHREDGAVIIGSVNAETRGVVARTVHFSLAEREAAVIGVFDTFGDGARALLTRRAAQ